MVTAGWLRLFGLPAYGRIRDEDEKERTGRMNYNINKAYGPAGNKGKSCRVVS